MSEDVVGLAPLGKSEEKVATNPALALTREAAEQQAKNIEQIRQQVEETRAQEAQATGFKDGDEVVILSQQEAKSGAGEDKKDEAREEKIAAGPPYDLET